MAADAGAQSSRRQLPITEFAHKTGNGRRPLPAAIGIVRSAGRGRARLARRASRPTCCRSAISTSSSLCRPRSPTSPGRTRRSSTTCCSGRPAETTMMIAADPRHLGARIGVTAVLHTWGSAMTHHPHVHMIAPGGGSAPGGQRWIIVAPGLPPAGAGAGRALPPAVSGPA